MNEKVPSISNFYQGRSILITGATGYIGKALVEKLLRSCPGIKTIYLLIRPKKDHEPKERLEELLKSKLFERVKMEQPSATSKLVAIHGDSTIDRLGMCPSDEELITENVSVVFHVAATVRFDDPLKRAFETNVLGTCRLIELCRKMKNLKAFVHLSTAFCNCNHEIVKEEVYPDQIPAQKLISAFEWMDENLLNALSPHLFQTTPNTYVYTKALAEKYLAQECHDLPITIVRPSIVSGAWEEPYPGWVDTYNDPTGLLLILTKGLLRCLYHKQYTTADLIPVDIVVNLVIAAAWHTAVHRPNSIMVYHCTSNYMNKITWRHVGKYAVASALQYPSDDVFRYPINYGTDSKILNFVFTTICHKIPAYFYDFLAVMTGRKPRLIRLYNKLHQILETHSYFITRDWIFLSTNAAILQKMLSPEDAKVFNFNVKSLFWPNYFDNYILGIRQFLLKEDPATLPSARKKLIRLLFYERLMKYSLIVFLLGLLRKIFIH